MILFRPVGLNELRLIFKEKFTGFPPRFDWQPIFYPVLNEEYAKEIAFKWNIKDKNSQYCGFITKFTISDSFISDYQSHIVGTSTHEEYWIPSEKLNEFNKNIAEKIAVSKMYYGSNYSGVIPSIGNLAKNDIFQQLKILYELLEYSLWDFSFEIKTNLEAIYFNYPYWINNQITKYGLSLDKIIKTIEMIETVWNEKKIFPNLLKNSELVNI